MPPPDAGHDSDLEAWFERLDRELASPGSASLGAQERALLLDLARVAAHRGVRVGAPITTYLAGLAFSVLEPGERLARLRDLVEALDTD